jgi:hypothetical protein
MTATDLALILMREEDESSDDAEMLTTVIGWISDAVDAISSACDWRIFKAIFPFSTQPTVATYDMDASLVDIRSIRFVDTDEPIHYKDDPRLFSTFTNLEEPGKPRDWFIDSQDDDPATAIGAQPIIKIRFHPIPDDFYTLTISAQKHPIVTALTPLQAIPLRQEMLLMVKDWVTARIRYDDKDYEGGDRFLAAYNDRLQKMVAKEESGPGARELRMQVTDIAPSGNNQDVRFDPAHFNN